ncbi:MAG: flagellar FliJ family protein [bacterium]|nr:flagellar FliJ family protein [bacterium]
MKKFQFRLQKLLHIKSHKKMERQKELAKAERVRRMEEAHLELLQSRMSQEISDLQSHKIERVDCRWLTQSAFYQQRLISNMATQKQVISNALKQEELKREKLISAAREEKVFDMLKDRQRERYNRELDDLQQKETDEIARNTFLQGEHKGKSKSPR